MSARRKHKEEHSEGGERWLITYADLVTLLFAVFIVLYAGSNSDEERFGRTAEGIRQAFDVGLGVLSGGGSDPGVFEEGGDAVPLPTVQGNSDAEPVLREVNALAQSHGLSGQVNVRLEEGRLIIALANDLLFDAASASIDEQAITFLSDLGGVLVDLPQPIQVEGHTNSVPINTEAFPSNWELSTARATAVLRFLVEQAGVSASRIHAAGFADQRPIADNVSAEGRAANRRANVVILFPPDELAESLPAPIGETGAEVEAALR